MNSMDKEIGQTFMYLSIAKALWDAVSETYLDMGNYAQIYEIKTKIWERWQGE